jgi:hypothetical protein
VTLATLWLATEHQMRSFSAQQIHAPIGGVAQRLPYNADMGETKFLVIQERDGRVSVEMTKPNGRPRVFPDFRDEADARAWIIQTQRLIGIEMPTRR